MISHLRKKWIPRETTLVVRPDDIYRAAVRLGQTASLDPLLARLLALREVAPETVDEFLNGSLAQIPDPFLLKGMAPAVDRIVEEIRAGGRPLISADFDVDGITACALLVEFFQALGVDVYHFVPDRKLDGYGLSARALQRAAEVGVNLVISVDCGISAIEEASYAKKLGLDLIITDHHQPPEVLPEACAIVNPHQPGCSFPFRDLSGAGVAFFLAVAVRKTLREAGCFKDRPEPDLRRSLDLAGLSTIADIVPLKGVNRILTKAGLRLMDSDSRPGIAALRHVAEINRISCGTVAFGLAPRLNATGRLAEGHLGVQLLLEQDRGKALEMAETMDRLNRERQDVERRIVDQAVERIEKGERGQKSIVLAAEGWHPGVIGIVASRIVELYHRPTAILSLEGDSAKGSGRSIRGFHLFRALESCREHLAGFGGHEYAAGMSLPRANVDAFAAAFDKVADKSLSDEDLLPTIAYDSEIGLVDVTVPMVQGLQVLEPFGMGNPGPVFLARELETTGIKQVGKDGKHLSFIAKDGARRIKCIAFGMGDAADSLGGRRIDMLFKVSVNEWQGAVSAQAEVLDFRAANN